MNDSFTAKRIVLPYNQIPNLKIAHRQAPAKINKTEKESNRHRYK